ncbi:MAG: aspartyl/glutamyl-tRNA amidotransferase subunit C [Gemmatimonadales bacterium]|jgi:aspartyl-tRNA(Asn)/glutamyl-tRNA(Gln) amidotransferase subunit C
MSVSHDDVRHIAALARVGIDERRLPALAAELSSILDHMAVLTRVDSSDVADIARDGDVHLRPDSGPPIPLLRPLPAFAPMVRDGFLIVPRLATHGGGGHGAPAGDDRPDEEDSA